MRLCALALLPVILLALAGCYFDQPLSGPDRNIDTWLNGVWEYKNDKGETYRAGVIEKDCDHYTMWVRKTGKTPKDTKNYRFTSWISRVDKSYFITARCEESPGDIPPGGYIFINYIVTGATTVALRQLQFDAPQNASSFQLRAAVRARLKKRSLYLNEGITANHIGLTYREHGGVNVLDQPLLPPQAPPPPRVGAPLPFARQSMSNPMLPTKTMDQPQPTPPSPQ